MKLYPIETGNFMLDGGAMFGVIPKSIWQKWYPCNEKNLCNLAMRCLLVDDGKYKILIDTGIGNKQDNKFFGYYYLNGDQSLAESLKTINIHPDEITHVILTHLHFDHCGGAVTMNHTGAYVPVFKNARHIISRKQWDLANNPNKRERPSYKKENFLPLQEYGLVDLIDSKTELIPNIRLELFNGHTSGQIIPFIRDKNKTLVFTADLIPLMPIIPAQYVCGYDTMPLETIKEKERFLQEAMENECILFFEHDLYHECCNLKMTEKGIRPDSRGLLNILV